MQLAALLAGVVHAGDARAHLEAQPGHVAHRARDREQVLAAHEEGELAAVDDDLLDGVVVADGPSASVRAVPSRSATSSKQEP